MFNDRVVTVVDTASYFFLKLSFRCFSSSGTKRTTTKKLLLKRFSSSDVATVSPFVCVLFSSFTHLYRFFFIVCSLLGARIYRKLWQRDTKLFTGQFFIHTVALKMLKAKPYQCTLQIVGTGVLLLLLFLFSAAMQIGFY